ncbi:Gfo/Idh/MocA family oxidoreductase [Haloarcula amylovorans]|uniref:hypothetical protein n=1 Tax=Haloarcula amylovorans TaxID=2562280 RepID=UPI0010760EFA
MGSDDVDTRFGVLSTARIGRESVIPAIQRSDHEVAAIGSRDADRARAVTNELGIESAYGDYEAMLTEAAIERCIRAPRRERRSPWPARTDWAEPFLPPADFGRV